MVRDPATRSARLRVLLVIAIAFASFAVFLWWRGKGSRSGEDTIIFNELERAERSSLENASASPSASLPATPPLAAQAEASPSPLPIPSAASDKTPSPSNESAPPTIDLTTGGNYLGTLKLIVPVVGVRSDQLLDTFTDARSEGRVHDAIDIPAPAGTPVVAAADGEIIKLFQSVRGGTTIYQLSTDRKLVFYYAHLQRYADGLTAGKFAKQGEVIAYVGDTGNAGPGNYHLHFSIAIVADPKRYWEGTNINPYPLLHK